jgi:hypothetical protein
MFTVAIASLALVIGLFPRPALGGAVPSSSAYTGGEQERMMTLQAAPPDYICEDGETVLLIQDVVPWAAPGGGDPLGANVTELLAQGINFCMINSAAIDSTNLRHFSWILIAAAQNQGFYDNLFPSGTVHSDLAAYVEAGGTLSANLTDHASGPGGGGNWDTRVFVGGLQHVTSFKEDNDINDPLHPHPIVADGLPCPSANCALIQDSGTKNDLDNWFYASHGYFTSPPAGTRVILTDDNPGPVMIEYPFGAGKVIASLTTSVWRYVGGVGGLTPNKKLLANEIAYQDFAAKPVCAFEPEPNEPVVDRKRFKTAEVEFDLLFDAKGNSFDVDCVPPGGCTITTLQLKELTLDGKTLDFAPFDKPWGATQSPGCVYVRTRSGGVKKVCN